MLTASPTVESVNRGRSAGMAAVVQTAAGVCAHVAAAGCLPSLSGLALVVPVAVAAVLGLMRLLPHRPVLQLTGGQLAVHGALGLAAACQGAHQPHLLMTYAHVAAVVLLRQTLTGIVTALERAGRTARTLLPQLRPPVPAVDVPADRTRPAVARRAVLHPVLRSAPPRRRGPPVSRCAPRPASGTSSAGPPVPRRIHRCPTACSAPPTAAVSPRVCR